MEYEIKDGFHLEEDMKKVLNKCPVCGGKIVVQKLKQYTDVYGLTKTGRVSKKRIRRDDDLLSEASFLSCECCNFLTDAELNIEAPWELSKKIRIECDEDQYMYEERDNESTD